MTSSFAAKEEPFGSDVLNILLWQDTVVMNCKMTIVLLCHV